VASLRTLHVNAFFQGDEENPQLVVEYVTDIYNYLRYLESIQAVTPDYLAGQQVGDRKCYSIRLLNPSDVLSGKFLNAD
jgi:hypothetical protein